MSTSPTQLDELYRQLSEFFNSHPLISVTPTKGDPPDQYEITYTITGKCKTDDAEIVDSIEHIVELAIPFGFPHFPPSCKPKSNIFHPDFDPAAICLSDFWEQDRSLSELIIFIGQMINGEIYSATNAFNDDAAKWYQENSDKFPLAHIQWEKEDESKPSPDEPITHKIDTLDETDLSTEYDFLALEKELDTENSLPDNSVPEVDAPATADFEVISLLESQKKYYTLLKETESYKPLPYELSELCQRAKGEIRVVEKLHRDGKKFENKGDAQIALEKYQQITTIVSDFPTIDADIQRTEQTLALMADTLQDRAHDLSAEHTSPEPTDPGDNQSKPIKKDTSKHHGRVSAAKSLSPNELFLQKSSDKNKVPLFLFLGLIAIGIGYGAFYWYSSATNLSRAQVAYNQCSISQTTNKFTATKSLCDKALLLASEISFVHKDKADQLKESILEILQSEKLSQGLAGKVLIDGRYIPQKEAKTLLSIQQQLEEAETLFTKAKWQPALKLYETLLAQTENSEYLDNSVIENIKRKLLLCKFRLSYDSAQISIQNKQWENAIEKLLQAQKILVSLSERDRSQYSEQLQNTLQKSQFANLKEQGDLSFTGSDWQSALASYNLALASGQETALPPESIAAIRNNIKRAELYTAINSGNKAFASGTWNDAIEAYNKAIDLLINSQGTPGELDSDINIRKLGRIILQASIIRDRQTAQNLRENNDFATARRTYLQIIASIKTSSFGSEEEFSKTAAEITAAIQSLDEKIYLNEKVAYLKDNYQSLFIANYPNVSAEELSNPVIKNTKKSNSKLVFRMQCTEKGGGRPHNLVMHYAYDQNTGKWSLFSEN